MRSNPAPLFLWLAIERDDLKGLKSNATRLACMKRDCRLFLVCSPGAVRSITERRVGWQLKCFPNLEGKVLRVVRRIAQDDNSLFRRP